MLPTRQLCGTTSTLAYLVLLRVEIARFTPSGLPCGTPPGLVSVALILTSRWAAVSCYAALCSPDVPPVPGFPDCTSGGLARFTGVIILERDAHSGFCHVRWAEAAGAQAVLCALWLSNLHGYSTRTPLPSQQHPEGNIEQ